MSRMFSGTIYGTPCVKITQDDADNPWATPDTDVHKFLFNSNYQELGYITKKATHFFDNTGIVFGTPAAVNHTYYPAGSDSTNALWCRSAHVVSGVRHVTYVVYLDRLGFNPNAHQFIALNNHSMPDYVWRNAWRRAWENYPRSTDNYVSSMRQIISSTGTSRPWIFSEFDASTDEWSWWPHNAVGEGLPIMNVRTESSAFVANNSPEFVIYELDLPFNNDPYPAVVGTPTPDQLVFRFAPDMARIAKPGFDVRTATPEQCIIHEDRIPLKLARSGYFTIGPGGAIVTIDMRGDYGNDVLVDYQVEQIGDGMFIPPIPRGDGNNEFLVEYRIDGPNLIFRNSGVHTMGVRFFVMAENSNSHSVGAGRIIERGDGYLAICKPETDGTQLADRMLDTRFQVMPIIDQGYVPWSAMVSSDAPKRGSRMHLASWTNSGFKPYVIAKKHARSRTDPNKHRFFPMFSKAIEYYGYAYSADTTFMCELTDSWAKFYCHDGGVEDAYRGATPATTFSQWEALGFRYYIFAVPASL